MSISVPSNVSVKDLRYGHDPAFDAWLLHLMTENNIEYTISPLKNASPEQIRFMVALEEDTIFLPCSDWMFSQLATPEIPPALMREYLSKWKVVARLARRFIVDDYLRRKVLNLCRHRFRLYVASSILIPSRLLKQLTTIVLAQSGMDDPYRMVKQWFNRRAKEVIDSPEFENRLNICPGPVLACRRIKELRREIDRIEVWRLLRFSTLPSMWTEGKDDTFLDLVLDDVEEKGTDIRRLDQALGDPERSLTILFLPDRCGGIMFDLRTISGLLRMGHRVILALKEGFYFNAPTLWDQDSDPILAEALRDAYILQDDRVSKNRLLQTLQAHPFVVISDGTRERLNLYRTSVTFARTWKEADLIMAKGEANYFRLIQTSHSFTRDVLSFYRDESGQFHIHFKPKSEKVIKFSERDLSDMAEEIISGMRQAAQEGRTVMFYSGIIGSIPGQVKVAIEIMNAFIVHLRSRLEGTFIINPAEHFVEGMDADDLMYMWEKVQRCGYINLWRFQSSDDIERSFELLGRKVPPVWTGKDATYSTGCTKEMHIALDVQRAHPELQIIGPGQDKFFRRREYGVGKFCDVAIDEC